MNRNRQPMEKRTRKKMEKEVKAAQKLLFVREPVQKSDTLTPKDLLQKQPKLVAKKEKYLLDSMKKSVARKQAKLKGPHTKRTTPGEVLGRDGSPAHAKTESERWEHVLVLQNKFHRSSMNRKMNKNRTKKR